MKADESKKSLTQRIEDLRRLFNSYHRKEHKEEEKKDEEDAAAKRRGSKRDDLAKTLFEDVEVKARPAVSTVRKRSTVRWKPKSKTEKHDDATVQHAEGDLTWGPDENMSISDVVQHRDFKSAQKIMAEVKKSKIMESLLDLSDTEVLRKLFETELAQPSNKVFKEVKLLHRALNKLWEELMCNIAKYSFDHDILLFLCEREKVKARILDVMLTCPQNLPDSWGGRRMCACVEGSSIRQLLKSLNREDVSVIPSPITQSVPSQWTKHMKEIADEKLKKSETPIAEKKGDAETQKEGKDEAVKPSADVIAHDEDDEETCTDVGMKKIKKSKRKSKRKAERKDKVETATSTAVKSEKTKKEDERVKDDEGKANQQKLPKTSDYDNVNLEQYSASVNFDEAREKQMLEQMKKGEKQQEGVIEKLCQQDMITNAEKEQKQQGLEQKDLVHKVSETKLKVETDSSKGKSDREQRDKEKIDEKIDEGKDKGHVEEEKHEHGKSSKKRIKEDGSQKQCEGESSRRLPQREEKLDKGHEKEQAKKVDEKKPGSKEKKVDEKKEDGEKKAVEKQEDKVKSPVKKEVDSKKVTETEAAKKGTEKKVLEREDVEKKDKDQEENKKEKRLEKAGEEKKKEKKLEKSDEEKKKDKKMEKPEEDKKKEKKLEKSGEERKKEKNVEKAEEDKKKTDLKDNLKKEIEEKEEPPKKVMKVRKMQSTEKPRGAVLVKQKQASEPMGAGEAEKPPEAKDLDGEEKKCVDAKSSALTAKPSEIKREAEEVATRRISSKEQKPIHKAREAALAVIRKMSSKAEPSPVAKRSAVGVRSKKSATGK